MDNHRAQMDGRGYDRGRPGYFTVTSVRTYSPSAAWLCTPPPLMLVLSSLPLMSCSFPTI